MPRHSARPVQEGGVHGRNGAAHAAAAAAAAAAACGPAGGAPPDPGTRQTTRGLQRLDQVCPLGGRRPAHVLLNLVWHRALAAGDSGRSRCRSSRGRERIDIDGARGGRVAAAAHGASVAGAEGMDSLRSGRAQGRRALRVCRVPGHAGRGGRGALAGVPAPVPSVLHRPLAARRGSRAWRHGARSAHVSSVQTSRHHRRRGRVQLARRLPVRRQLQVRRWVHLRPATGGERRGGLGRGSLHSACKQLCTVPRCADV
eukprot:3935204-Prymnesium_polylepis.2